MFRRIKSVTQLVHTLTVGDAVSDSALNMHEVFLRIGLHSRILALAVHPKLSGLCETVNDSTITSDLVILHYSIGGPILDKFVTSSSFKKGIVFHNITPPEFFDGVNTNVKSIIIDGLQNLEKVISVSDFVFSDSSHNIDTLKSLVHFSASSIVLPLTIRGSRFERISILDKINWTCVPKQQKSAKVKCLYVGRIAPNKNLELCLKSFAVFRRCYEGDSLLWFVGNATDCELYKAKLKCLADFLGILDRVVFWGHVSDGFLKILFENASVYLALSKHEGFCVPVIEAMRFGLPVLAKGGTAVEETLGNSGFILNSNDPLKFAEAIFSLLSKKNQIVESQRTRLRDFSFERFEQNLVSALEKIDAGF
ncbi:MAG: glycosyltransferase [Deltaproteobacteria bacterium]|nr:glycosyltransferase [Deltaproteobacteria bacterium]